MNYQPLYDIDGLQFVPVNEHKAPIIKNWQTSKEKHNLNKGAGVGLVCGEPSGNVECIDVDLKYDLTGKLFDEYKKSVYRINKDILGKLVVQKTRSGGRHLIYRCSVIQGNTKLANRHTTEEERLQTYQASYKKKLNEGGDEAAARLFAQRESENDKVRVLFETRGLGGQFVCSPTPGYEFIFGDLCSISEITPEEREVLFSCAMHFNQYFEEPPLPKMTKREKTQGMSAFEDYNQRGDVENLLVSHGWKIVKRKGQKTHFLRPGQSTAATSGNYDHEKGWFSVFTTSTDFEPMKAYLPYAVFAKLECKDDYAEASKRLFDLGYGEKPQVIEKEKQPSTRVIQSRIDPLVSDQSYFSATNTNEDYFRSVRDGTLQMGLTTGSPELDRHFLFKKGNLVMTNGIDNVGKTEFILWLELIAAMYHGWKGVIFSGENTVASLQRRLIQLFWGKPLAKGDFQMSEKEFLIARNFIDKHFRFIQPQEQLFNYKDIINLMKIALNEGDYQYGMIDPYNALKTDLSGFSKLSTHEYHYEALSEIKAFGQSKGFGWFINNHAVTSALRQKDADRKYPVAPRKEDTEGGGKFSNKADDFGTIHRLTQHPQYWSITEFHIRKIKDTETGGKPTPLDEPVRFNRYKGGYAYEEWIKTADTDGYAGVDPIAEWHYERKEMQRPAELKKAQGWLPYKDDVSFEDSNDTTIGF